MDGDINFVIPQKLEDLSTFSRHKYVVNIDYNAEEVNEKIPVLYRDLLEAGPEFILEHFDVFYGVLKRFNNIESKIRDQSWKIILRGCEHLIQDFQDELNEEESQGIIDRKRKCNILKMLVFVLCTMIELFEEREAKAEVPVEAVEKGRRKKDTASKKSTEDYDWERHREKGLEVLMKICLMSLHRLFSPPVVEEEFVDLTTRACYKVLENPSVTKKENIKHLAFQIIANAVSKHKHSLNFCLKVIQLLQHKDFLSKDLASLVELMVKDHGQKLVVSELMREIEQVDMNRESSLVKALGEFMKEMADRVPKALIPCITIVLDFLECDAYTIRSAALSAVGSIVLELSKDDVSDKHKKLRDQLLDKLEEHILDVAVYTRGRSIQVWTTLCSEGKIPIVRLDNLIELIVGRLQDKTVYVRRQAVLFLTEFLKSNPFAAKLPLDLLKEKYEVSNQKLEQMMEGVNDSLGCGDKPNSPKAEDEWPSKWKQVESELVEYWMNVSFDDDSASEEDGDVEMESNFESIESAVDAVRLLVLNKKFPQVRKVIGILRREFSNHSIFTADDDLSSSDESDEESSNGDIPTSVKFIKKIFLLGSEKRTETSSEAKGLDKEGQQLVIACLEGGENRADDLINDVSKLQMLVKYLKDCVRTAEQIMRAIPDVCNMLYSPNISDAQAAIDFFVTASEFGVQGALIGIRKMIVLVFSRDKAVHDAVISAYKKVYLNNPALESLSHRQRSLAVVKSLTDLVEGATEGELEALDELLTKLMEAGDIRNEHTHVLFEKFSKKIPNTTDQEAVIACRIIAMLARANRKLVVDNIDNFITVGLSTRPINSQLVKETLGALQKAATEDPKVEDTSPQYRLENSHRLFHQIHDILLDGITNLDDDHFIPMSTAAIKTIYFIADHPASLCEELVRDLLNIIMPEGNSGDSLKENEDQSNVGSRRSSNSSQNPSVVGSQVSTQVRNVEEDISEIHPTNLTRFVSIIGDVALYQLMHIESAILTEIKIRKSLKEAQDAEKKQKRGATTATKTRPGTTSGNAEEEIGLAGASAVDDDIEQFKIYRIIDDPKNILCILSPLVVTIVTNPDKFSDPQLKTASTLTLAKFMLCSQTFCNNNLRLLFTILKRSEDPVIRQNTIISLGDLCVRYPNLLDPWTAHLYAPLDDQVVSVRTSALKVLSRLILCDMIKVKGQISELGKCIVDDDETLSSLAILFFNEYKKKENAIYNVLPDIISNLSGGEEEMDECKFQGIMKFLIPLVEKERHVQSLIEKICQRFRATTVERQWKDLAFCLHVIKYQEQRIARLYENMGCFADKLPIDAVYDAIMSIIQIGRKIQTSRQGVKEMLDEFEQKVEECRSKGIQHEDESEIQKVVGTPPSSARKSVFGHLRASATKATVEKKTTRVASTKKTQPKKSTRARKVHSDDDEDNEPGPSKPQPVRESSRPTRAARKNIQQIFEDDEDDDSD